MAEIVVDCARLKNNYLSLKRATDSLVCAVVKANAYGHGLVASRYIAGFADAVGVASNAEALELCDFARSVIVIGAFGVEMLDDAVFNGISITCDSVEAVREVHLASRRVGAMAKIHIKIDSGMRRLGAGAKEFAEIVQYAYDRSVVVEGVFSHFACADCDRDFTERQFELFNSLTAGMRCVRHISNSAAFLRYKKYHLDMSRVGIALYGGFGFLPSLSFRAKIVAVRKVVCGDSVGYSNAFVADRDMVVAVVSAGYADGVFRSLSNRGSAVVGGRRCRIVGNICMDLFMVDISGVCGTIELGDWAYLICDEYSVGEMASDAGTIPYEIFTRLGTRPKRVYLNTENVDANKKRGKKGSFK